MASHPPPHPLACGNCYSRLCLPWELSLPPAYWSKRVRQGSDWSARWRPEQGMGNVLHSLDVGVSSTRTYKMSNILVSIHIYVYTVYSQKGNSV